MLRRRWMRKRMCMILIDSILDFWRGGHQSQSYFASDLESSQNLLYSRVSCEENDFF